MDIKETGERGGVAILYIPDHVHTITLLTIEIENLDVHN
jgi:hypothetical protein